jgi:hypothetical protein
MINGSPKYLVVAAIALNGRMPVILWMEAGVVFLLNSIKDLALLTA